MASAPTASNFSAPAGAPAAAGASLLPSFATAASPGSPQAGAAQPPDAFLQLFAGMINTTTGNAPAASPATLQDLTALPLEFDADGLLETLEPGEKSDADSDDTDTDADEAGALAIAALLPGLIGATPSSGATTQGTSEGQRVELTTLTTARLAAEVADAATDGLSDETTDAAGNPSPATTDSSAASATPQNVASTTTAHMNALLSTHAAVIADAVADVIVQSPVGSAEWKDEIGNHITLMAVNGREAASLRLSPEHLGPVEIRISVDDGKASVYFGAANADTRSALEQSLPRLRELFATQGLVLADAGVSRDAPRNQFKPAATPNGARGSSDAAADTSVKSVTLARVGLIDTYV